MTFSFGSLALIITVWSLLLLAMLLVVTVLNLPAWAAVGLGVVPWLITRSLVRDLRRPERRDR